MIAVIRRAAIDDGYALFDLAKKFATSFSPEKAAFDKSLKELIDKEYVNLSVAILENTIVGYCLGFDHYAFYANGRVSWVEEIMVLEEYRKNGIGRKLMENFERWGMARKSKLVGLATRRAGPFYERLGYENSAVYYRRLL